MRNIKQKFLHIILPAMILTPLLWLMAGCIYVPWFEHRIDSGPNIRAMIGPANSDRMVKPGSITRAKVIELLGSPKYASADGTALGYVTRTQNGVWVWPICFAAVPGNRRTYAVRLVFDPAGYLLRYDWADANYEMNAFNLTVDLDPSEANAISKLNHRDGPALFLANRIRLNHDLTIQPR